MAVVADALAAGEGLPRPSDHRRVVCHVTTVHSRRDTRIFAKECRSLAEAGYDVHLVVGDGEGSGVVRDITIHDIGARPALRLFRMWRQPVRALRVIEQLQPAIVHIHDPELLPIGARLADRGVKVVYDAHEDVPRQIFTKSWIPFPLRMSISAAFAYYERRVVRRLTGVVAATPSIALHLVRLGPPTICISNYPLPDELAPTLNRVAKRNTVCYVGVITRLRGILSLLRALPLVPEVRLTLCGTIGEVGLEAEMRAEPGWRQVDFLGEADRETVRRVLGESLAGMVSFLPAPNHLDSQPNKLFEYMSAELPVIASDFPLWRHLIEDAGAGLCVDPESSMEIAAAIRRLIADREGGAAMGRAGRTSVVREFNWPREAKKLVAFYAGLI